jgi:hypothetical protein
LVVKDVVVVVCVAVVVLVTVVTVVVVEVLLVLVAVVAVWVVTVLVVIVAVVLVAEVDVTVVAVVVLAVVLVAVAVVVLTVVFASHNPHAVRHAVDIATAHPPSDHIAPTPHIPLSQACSHGTDAASSFPAYSPTSHSNGPFAIAPGTVPSSNGGPKYSREWLAQIVSVHLTGDPCIAGKPRRWQGKLRDFQIK